MVETILVYGSLLLTGFVLGIAFMPFIRWRKRFLEERERKHREKYAVGYGLLGLMSGDD